MNTRAPLSATPALKLPRPSAIAPGPIPDGAAGDELDEFREREANLRAYEEKLRTWQAQLDAQSAPAAGGPPPARPGSRAPFAADGTLEAAWEKLYRARALLEAEQHQLRDERMALRELDADLKRREAAMAQREAQVVAREQERAAAAAAVDGTAGAARTPSAVQRLTQAPFLAAKAVFKVGR